MFPVFSKLTCALCRKQIPSKKYFKTSSALYTFWERDEKGGYNTKLSPTIKEKVLVGLRELKCEIALWSQEVKERFEHDPFVICRPGEVDVAFSFENEECLKKWIVTSDSDHNEGKSKSSLELTKNGKALFSGNLVIQPPIDGRVKRAGYCNMKSVRMRKSFKRESYFDWGAYNMLVMRVRGDGRSYLLNLHTKGYWDVTWNDVFHYVLFTRGGPYWQVARIPFSKFFLSSKGRIQDLQSPVALDRITSFGISAAERISGDFALEIDYIGLEYDPSHTEEFAYEMYRTQPNICAT